MVRRLFRSRSRLKIVSGTFAVMWFCLGTSHQANAGELRISIQDADTGTPLEDVIVEVILPAESQPTYLTTVDASVDQQEKEFVANVTVITRGSRANFPNSDDILHHVYSFSPAKVFELPLYGNGQNIDYYQLFDLPGVIELGCNIHDWMLGYIYVSQTDLVAKTDRTGQAVISNIPAGEYEVRIWHSRADTGAPEMNQQVVFSDTQPARLQMALTLQRDSRLRRAPDATRTRYR